MVTMLKIQTLVDEIALGYKPDKINLFGSYANGTPSSESDIDLFIVKNTDVRKIHRSIEVREMISDYFAPMDIIVYTPKELKKAMTIVHNIGKIATNTGKLMYERV